MEDDIDALQYLFQPVWISCVTYHEFDIGGKITRQSARMDLRSEVIQNSNVVSRRNQPVSEVRTNETGPSGDQNLFTHS